jgi:hypothetical protein
VIRKRIKCETVLSSFRQASRFNQIVFEFTLSRIYTEKDCANGDGLRTHLMLKGLSFGFMPYLQGRRATKFWMEAKPLSRLVEPRRRDFVNGFDCGCGKVGRMSRASIPVHALAALTGSKGRGPHVDAHAEQVLL